MAIRSDGQQKHVGTTNPRRERLTQQDNDVFLTRDTPHSVAARVDIVAGLAADIGGNKRRGMDE